jgi:hypothetical protein
MKRFLALSLVAAVIGLGIPVSASAAPSAGVIAGMAKDWSGQAVPNVTVRLRNLVSGSLAGTTRTAASGAFTFENVAAGHYVVETVDLSGRVTAASSAVDLSAGAALKNILVTAPRAMAGQGTAAAAGGGSFFTSTAGILLIAAAAAGTVIAIVATTGDESPSK